MNKQTKIEQVPSIKDVARLAGVGIGTVSRVINDAGSVSPATRERVLKVIEELDYVPSLVAQSMRNYRTMTFACIMRDFTVPVLSMFVDAMQKIIHKSGFSLIVASSNDYPKQEITLLQRLDQRRIDGLVITTSSETSSEVIDALERVKFPIVLMDRETPRNFDSVLINHAMGTYEAVQYLIKLGHKRIGFISGQADLHPTISRLDGYRKALRDARIRYNPNLVKLTSFHADTAYISTIELFKLSSPPTAIVAGGTSFLPGLMRAIRSLGLIVPDDVSIVAGADSDVATLITPTISRVRWNHDEVGQAAGQLLLDRIENPDEQPKHLMFDSEFIIGDSCAPPSTQ